MDGIHFKNHRLTKSVHQCSLTVVPAACQFKIQIQTLKYYCKSNDTLSYYFTFNVRRP